MLEQAVMRSDSQSIDAAQLERILREAGVEPAAPAPVQDAPLVSDADDESRYLRPLAEQVAELERRAIAAAMKAQLQKAGHARPQAFTCPLYGRGNPE